MATIRFRRKFDEPEIVISSEAEAALALENNPTNKLPTETKQKHLHPLLKELKDEWKEQRIDSNGLIESRKSQLRLKVAPRSADRAVRILATLFQAFEKRGYEFGALPKGERSIASIFVIVLGRKIRFKIQERTSWRRIQSLDEIKDLELRQQLSWRIGWQDNRALLANGTLYLEIESYISVRKVWSDRGGKKLEEMVDDFLRGLIYHSEAERQDEIERKLAAEERERQREAEEARKLPEKVRLARAEAVKLLADKFEHYIKLESLVEKLKQRSASCERATTEFTKIERITKWAEGSLVTNDPLAAFLQNPATTIKWEYASETVDPFLLGD